MSTGSDGLAARSAAFRDALRRADLLVAARAAALLAIVLSGWLALPHDPGAGDAAGGGAPAAAGADAAVPILPQSRGRVILAVAAAPVVAEPQATVVPDPVTVVVPSPAGSPA